MTIRSKEILEIGIYRSTLYRFVSSLSLIVIASSTLLPGCVQAQGFNGFDVSNATIDTGAILSGGPPRDGIPSIDEPKFVDVDAVDYLRDDDIVVGLVMGNVTRAYPLRILVWHEIVNDVIAGSPVAVTYCPLCGTAMVFDRRVGDVTRTFGVSGLLYQSDVLMFDRETESLWSQLATKAVAGASVGESLEWLPSEHLTWKAWQAKYPDSEVLSTDTGHSRRYAAEAYASYFASSETMFPVPKNRDELANKAWVIGVVVNGASAAYSVADFSGGSTIDDRVANIDIAVHFDKETRQHKVTDSDGQVIPSVMVFWFAWQAFYPNTQLWQE